MELKTQLKETDGFLATLKKFHQKTNQSEEDEQEEDFQKDFPEEEPTKLVFSKGFRFEKWPEKERDERKDFITFCERHYFEFKSLPNRADFEQHFPKNILPKTIEEWKPFLMDLIDPLEARGIKPYDVPFEYLEPQFVTAVTFITDVNDKRSVTAKLKQVGLSTKTWQALLAQPKYKEYYKKRIDELTEGLEQDAKLNLATLVQAKDLQAIKFFFELQNIYRPRDNANDKIMLALRAIMEILQENVEPHVLAKVAAQIRGSDLLNQTAIEAKAS